MAENSTASSRDREGSLQYAREPTAKTRRVSPTFGGGPEWMLLHAARVAMRPTFLIAGAMGAVLASLGWSLTGLIFLPNVASSSPEGADRQELQVNAQYFEQIPGDPDGPADPFGWQHVSCVRWLAQHIGPAPENPVTAIPYRMLEPFHQTLRPQPSLRVRGYYLLGGVWTWVVWSFAGGAITHMAISVFSREQTRHPALAIRHAWSRLPSQLGTMLLPTVGICFLAIPLACCGIVMRSDLGLGLAGLCWILILPVAFVMTLILMTWSFAWPLSWGALSSEGIDAFDAFSRSMSYAFQKPGRYLWYLVVVSVGGLIGWIVVWIASELIVQMAMYGAAAGMGADRLESLTTGQGLSSLSRAGAGMIRFWNGAVRMLGSAFAFSYFWTAMAPVYLLLRYDVDGTELDEIDLEHDPVNVYGPIGVPPEDAALASSTSRSGETDSSN